MILLSPCCSKNMSSINVIVCGVVSVSIYGSRSEGNSGSVWKNQMVVNCEYKEGRCLFTGVADFFL